MSCKRVDLEQTPHSVASHLVLHCLLRCQMMIWYFTSHSTLFNLYGDIVGVIIKASVQLSAVQS